MKLSTRTEQQIRQMWRSEKSSKQPIGEFQLLKSIAIVITLNAGLPLQSHSEDASAINYDLEGETEVPSFRNTEKAAV